jgi:hypothetical protein
MRIVGRIVKLFVVWGRNVYETSIKICCLLFPTEENLVPYVETSSVRLSISF